MKIEQQIPLLDSEKSFKYNKKCSGTCKNVKKDAKITVFFGNIVHILKCLWYNIPIGHKIVPITNEIRSNQGEVRQTE